MLGVYKLNVSCGKMGYLDGVFVADDLYVKVLIEHKVDVYFGEVLGKHSEIYGSISEDEIKLITNEKDVVALFEEYNFASGYNPFEYDLTEADEENEIYSVIDYIKFAIRGKD